MIFALVLMNNSAEIAATAGTLPQRGVLQEFAVSGAGCASCVTKIETALKNVPGVAAAEMNFAQSCGGNISAARLFLADLP